eukprot:397697-Pelagomonas_calceolata.AAC.1
MLSCMELCTVMNHTGQAIRLGKHAWLVVNNFFGTYTGQLTATIVFKPLYPVLELTVTCTFKVRMGADAPAQDNMWRTIRQVLCTAAMRAVCIPSHLHQVVAICAAVCILNTQVYCASIFTPLHHPTHLPTHSCARSCEGPSAGNAVSQLLCSRTQNTWLMYMPYASLLICVPVERATIQNPPGHCALDGLPLLNAHRCYDAPAEPHARMTEGLVLFHVVAMQRLTGDLFLYMDVAGRLLNQMRV